MCFINFSFFRVSQQQLKKSFLSDWGILILLLSMACITVFGQSSINDVISVFENNQGQKIWVVRTISMNSEYIEVQTLDGRQIKVQRKLIAKTYAGSALSNLKVAEALRIRNEQLAVQKHAEAPKEEESANKSINRRCTYNDERSLFEFFGFDNLYLSSRLIANKGVGIKYGDSWKLRYRAIGDFNLFVRGPELRLMGFSFNGVKNVVGDPNSKNSEFEIRRKDDVIRVWGRGRAKVLWELKINSEMTDIEFHSPAHGERYIGYYIPIIREVHFWGNVPPPPVVEGP